MIVCRFGSYSVNDTVTMQVSHSNLTANRNLFLMRFPNSDVSNTESEPESAIHVHIETRSQTNDMTSLPGAVRASKRNRQPYLRCSV